MSYHRDKHYPSQRSPAPRSPSKIYEGHKRHKVEMRCQNNICNRLITKYVDTGEFRGHLQVLCYECGEGYLSIVNVDDHNISLQDNFDLEEYKKSAPRGDEPRQGFFNCEFCHNRWEDTSAVSTHGALCTLCDREIWPHKLLKYANDSTSSSPQQSGSPRAKLASPVKSESDTTEEQKEPFVSCEEHDVEQCPECTDKEFYAHLKLVKFGYPNSDMDENIETIENGFDLNPETAHLKFPKISDTLSGKKLKILGFLEQAITRFPDNLARDFENALKKQAKNMKIELFIKIYPVDAVCKESVNRCVEEFEKETEKKKSDVLLVITKGVNSKLQTQMNNALGNQKFCLQFVDGYSILRRYERRWVLYRAIVEVKRKTNSKRKRKVAYSTTFFNLRRKQPPGELDLMMDEGREGAAKDIVEMYGLRKTKVDVSECAKLIKMDQIGAVSLNLLLNCVKLLTSGNSFFVRKEYLLMMEEFNIEKQKYEKVDKVMDAAKESANKNIEEKERIETQIEEFKRKIEELKKRKEEIIVVMNTEKGKYVKLCSLKQQVMKNLASKKTQITKFKKKHMIKLSKRD